MSNRPQFNTISPTLLRPRLPELGKIKLGGKGKEKTSQGGKKFQLPVKFDSFVVTTRVRGTDGNFVRDEAIHQKLGQKPTELDIRLMFDEPEENFRASLSAYNGRKRVCEGNGVQAFDSELNRLIPCTCPLLKQHTGGYDGPARPIGKVTCKPHGTLAVLLEAAETYGGFYVFRTTSWETIASIRAALDTFKAQFGFLAFLPLRMVMYPTTDSYEEGGQTKTSQSYKVGLVVRATMDTAFQLAAAARDRREQLLLAAPDVAEVHEQLDRDEVEEASEIAAEFHPETQEGSPPTVEAEYEIEDEPDPQAEAEELCRLALAASDWEQLDINRQVAKYSGRLDELAAILEEKMPDAWRLAREEYERLHPPAADEPEQQAEPELSDTETQRALF